MCVCAHKRERGNKRVDIMSKKDRIAFQNIANKHSNGLCSSSMEKYKVRHIKMKVIHRTGNAEDRLLDGISQVQHGKENWKFIPCDLFHWLYIKKGKDNTVNNSEGTAEN